ncbi:flotillin domain protein [Aspergillus sp. HF37]|nr:flotillin domain protein [Aspergillus sp. HF37]
MRYAIAQANEYLVLTGAGIDDLHICKKAIVMPWQRCSRISVSPFDFSLNLQAMTAEKLQFSLPAVFTIGPHNDIEALKKFALLLSGNPEGSSTGNQFKEAITPTQRNHVQDIVKGIIEGETRVIISSMSMEEIFKGRQAFKKKVIENVQQELDQLGLMIYNANVKELQDSPGSEYFAFLRRKAQEGALNQAKIDVAEARMKGEIGEADKKGRTKQEVSKIDADTAVLETKRKAEKSKADSELTNRQTEFDTSVQLAKIDAQRQAESRDADLQKQVESKRAEMQLERLRASDVAKSKAARETAEQKANASYFTEKTGADARLYKEKMEADALFYRQSKEADAALYQHQRETEGMLEMAKGYSALIDVFGGAQSFMQYRMMENGTYEKLAKANGMAISGLQPKISTWNTGNGNAPGDSMGPVRDVMQNLPPLLETIHEQTGISPPSWLAQMPAEKPKEGLLTKVPERNGIAGHE